MNEEKLLRYSMSIALLSRLLNHQQITDKEYYQIKQNLMKEFNILSDLTAMTA